MAKNEPAGATCDQNPDGIWRHFISSGQDGDGRERMALRNRLLMIYLHLVRENAERIHARLPHEVDLDDLIQAGTLGLKDAVESFDPTRGVKFETYSASRIRGAILDELRHLDWVPRLVRRRSGKVDRLRSGLEMELGRPPTEDEIAQRLGVPPQEMTRLLKDSRPVARISLSRQWFSSDEQTEAQDLPPDPKVPAPGWDLQQRDLQEFFTRGLNWAEKRIVVLYYYEDMTMDEISRKLGLSESRVSQMHSRIIERLQNRLAGRETELKSS